MSTTITDSLKQTILDELYASYTGKLSKGDVPAVGADNHYIVIGKGEQWTSIGIAPLPNPSTADTLEFQSSIQSGKKVEDVSYVIPRVNWSPGSIYTAWDNKYSSDTTFGTLNDISGSYYVITDQNNVYICVEQGKTINGVVKNSITKPTGTTSEVFSSGDGYAWKFMYNVGVFTARRYLTSNYIPVERVPNADEVDGQNPGDLSASRAEQKILQGEALPGELIGIAVDSGGIGYPPNAKMSLFVHPSAFRPTNSTIAKAYAETDVNGKIFRCVMKSKFINTDDFAFGSHYDKSTWVRLTRNSDSDEVKGVAGRGAVFRPMVCLDSGGLGADPRKNLNSSSIMYTSRLVGNEYKTFNVRNDFRQIGLVRNPISDSAIENPKLLTRERFDAMKKLHVTVPPEFNEQSIAQDAEVFEVANPYKRAAVDYYEKVSDTVGIVHCHQNSNTGWELFTATQSVLKIGTQDANSVADASPNPTLRASDMNNFSGKVLYIDNRVAIERDVDQTEDIKIIIDL
jgi:hypothetical protein